MWKNNNTYIILNCLGCSVMGYLGTVVELLTLKYDLLFLFIFALISTHS